MLLSHLLQMTQIIQLSKKPLGCTANLFTVQFFCWSLFSAHSNLLYDTDKYANGTRICISLTINQKRHSYRNLQLNQYVSYKAALNLHFFNGQLFWFIWYKLWCSIAITRLYNLPDNKEEGARSLQAEQVLTWPVFISQVDRSSIAIVEQ